MVEYHIRYGGGSMKFKSFRNEHIITVTPETQNSRKKDYLF